MLHAEGVRAPAALRRGGAPLAVERVERAAEPLGSHAKEREGRERRGDAFARAERVALASAAPRRRRQIE